MIENVFFFILLLNTTGLFRFFAPLLGITVGDVTIGLLIILSLYIIYHHKLFIILVPKMLPWLGMLLIWPAVTVFYSPLIDFRLLGLLAYGALLFSGSIIYAYENRINAVHRLFVFSIGITLLGEFLNFVFPVIFQSTAALADARVLTALRPGGFYLQPNSLGIGIVILFIGYLVKADKETIYLEPVTFLIFMISLLLTGSRTALIMGALVIFLHLGYQWYQHLLHHKQVKNIFKRLIVLLLIGVVGLISAKIIFNILSKQIVIQEADLLDRINWILSFRLTDLYNLLFQDVSIMQRTAIQTDYWQWSIKKPLLGYGLGAGAEYIQQGIFERSSHSTFLSQGFDFGIIYPIIMMGFILSLFFNRNRADLEGKLRSNSVTQFVIISILLYLWAGDLFRRREYLVVLGLFFTALNYPGILCLGSDQSLVEVPASEDRDRSDIDHA